MDKRARAKFHQKQLYLRQAANEGKFNTAQWVASENTQTPKFQNFPGRMGIPIPDEMGCGKKNRKGGGAPPFYFFLENLFKNLFDYC